MNANQNVADNHIRVINVRLYSEDSFDSGDLEEDCANDLNWSQIEEANNAGLTRGKLQK